MAQQAKAAALAAMDLTAIMRAYINQAVGEGSGYKALLLDRETMRVVSTIYGRSQLAEHGLVHVERLEEAVGDGKDHSELSVS